MMRLSIKSTILSRVAGAVAGVWLCGAGAAWAGDGADLGSLQALLSGTGGLCTLFNMNPCPQVPTITQGVLQVAGLGNNLPEMVRAQNNIPPESGVTAGNPALALTNPPPTVSDLMTGLTPLAFISQSSGTAAATQLYDSNADTFLYAVGVSSNGFSGATGLPDPDTAFFIYDDHFRTNVNFAIGTTIAKFSVPLTVLNNDGTERAVPTTLNFTATNAGDCSTSTVVGNFSGATGSQTLLASQIGINCSVVFSTSPTSRQKHAIFEVAVPLLITGACAPIPCTPSPNTDPAYFYSYFHPGPPIQRNPVNTGVYTAFVVNDLGSPPTPPSILGPKGVSIGLAPTAGPLGPPPAAGSSAFFALCAALPVNTNGTGAQLRPAVGAYYAMATSGEMLLSAPLPSASNSVCPPL
jgi:hypothetical protein